MVTQNQDGKNDHFRIIVDQNSIDYQPNLSDGLKIFNRWGVVVFSTTHYQNDWPPNNSNLASGIYFYKLDYSICPSRVGWIQLIKD